MPTVPEQNLAALDAIYDGAALQFILCNDAPELRTFASTSINLATNTISVTNTFANGSRVQLSTDGTLSSDITPGQVFYVISVTGSTLQLSTAFGGSVFDFTDQGTGTYTIAEVSQLDPVVGGIAYPVRTAADAVRMEISSYEGATVRPTLTGSAASLQLDPVAPGTQPDVAVTLLPVSVDNSAGANPIEFDIAYAITGGTTAPGNTTGALLDAFPFAATAIIAAGTSGELNLRSVARGGL